MHYDFNLILEANPIICHTYASDNNNYSQFRPFISVTEANTYYRT